MASGWTNRGKLKFLQRLHAGTSLPSNFYVALVTSTPSPDTNVLGDLSQINTGNGYSSGGVQVGLDTTDWTGATEDDTNVKAKIKLTDAIFAASGGAIPNGGSNPTYAVLTDDNGTVANREVLYYWSLKTDTYIKDGSRLRLDMHVALRDLDAIERYEDGDWDTNDSEDRIAVYYDMDGYYEQHYSLDEMVSGQDLGSWTDFGMATGTGAHFTTSTSQFLFVWASAQNQHTGKVSFCGWVRGLDVGVQRIVAGKDNGSTSREWVLWRNNSTNQPGWSVSVNGTSMTTVYSGQAMAANNWYFLGGRFDGTNLYIFHGDASGNTWTNSSGLSGNIPNSLNSLLIGRNGAGSPWYGAIDLMYYWGADIGSSAMSWMYNSGAGRTPDEVLGSQDANNPGTTSALGFWPLTESGPGFRMDWSGAKNHLHDNNDDTQESTTVRSRRPKMVVQKEDWACKATTQNKQIRVDTPCITGFPFTACGWFKVEPGQSGGGTVFGLYDNGGSTQWIRHRYSGTDSKMYFGIYDGTNNGQWSTGGTVNDGDWHWFAIQARDANYRSVWLDGGNTIYTTGPFNFPASLDNTCFLSRRYNSGSDGDFILGSIDEVMVFNEYLTGTELLEIYNGWSPVIGSVSRGAGRLVVDMAVDVPEAHVHMTHGWPFSNLARVEGVKSGINIDYIGDLDITTNQATYDQAPIAVGQARSSQVFKIHGPTTEDRSSLGVSDATLTQPDPTRQALFVYNSFNTTEDYPGFLEWGAWDIYYYTNGTSLTFTQPNMIFWCGAFHSTTTGQNICVLTGGDTTNRYYFRKNTSDQIRLSCDGSNTITYNWTFDSNWHVWTAIANGSNSRIYRDGNLVASGNAGSNTPNQLVLGVYSDLVNHNFVGYMGGLLIYNGLNQEAFTEIGQFFAKRHGVTWGHATLS